MIWHFGNMFEFLLAVEEHPAFDAEHLTIGFRFNGFELFHEIVPLCRIKSEHN
jgi:hypothetical protein